METNIKNFNSSSLWLIVLVLQHVNYKNICIIKEFQVSN